MNKSERLLPTFKMLRLVTQLVCASELCREYICSIIANFE